MRRETTANSTQIWHWEGTEPRPHWWEANAVTTVPSLLSSTRTEETTSNKLLLMITWLITTEHMQQNV